MQQKLETLIKNDEQLHKCEMKLFTLQQKTSNPDKRKEYGIAINTIHKQRPYLCESINGTKAYSCVCSEHVFPETENYCSKCGQHINPIFGWSVQNYWNEPSEYQTHFPKLKGEIPV